MHNLKYLVVVMAVLAAAFFLSEPQIGLAMNNYVDVMPSAINALPMLSSKILDDEWHEIAFGVSCALVRPIQYFF